MKFINFLVLLLSNAILNGAPLMYGTLGEILTEKSGNLNLGVEGMMYMGGIFGLVGAYSYETKAGAHANIYIALLIAILASLLAGAIGALIYSFLTITLRANQNVTGLALSIFGTGVAKFAFELSRTKAKGYIALSDNLKKLFSGSPFPKFLQNIPVIGNLIFGLNIFVYLGVLLAVGMHIFMYHTRWGLNLRSVGESPATADAAGINVIKYRYLATVIGGAISAVGGMVFITTISDCVWNQEALSGEGWLAVALVIFCLWRPLNSIWGSLLFGALLNLYMRIRLPIPTEIYKIVPYIITLVILIITSLQKKKENQPPEKLGVSYFREDR